MDAYLKQIVQKSKERWEQERIQRKLFLSNIKSQDEMS
jgi:hypothetical protein